ncbi:MAG: response regulator transcription factor [Proteobacteria bacterium]|nr:response regulator transcription factor [Pseudomonadota bacterium]
MEKISIVLVDDHTLVRQGIRMILEQEPDFQIVGEAGDGKEAIRKVSELNPDLVLLDYAMPGPPGGDVIAQIKRFNRADGYILKDTAAPELVSAIRSILKGGIYLSPSISKILVRGYQGKKMPKFPKSPYENLTRREREILKLLAEGYSVKEISANLKLSIKTVDAHKNNLMKKLDIHDRTHLVRYAIRCKLVEP